MPSNKGTALVRHAALVGLLALCACSTGQAVSGPPDLPVQIISYGSGLTFEDEAYTFNTTPGSSTIQLAVGNTGVEPSVSIYAGSAGVTAPQNPCTTMQVSTINANLQFTVTANASGTCYAVIYGNESTGRVSIIVIPLQSN